MPDPTITDTWSEGNFLARVTGFRGDGDAIVVDQDDNAWQIESRRLTLAECVDENQAGTGIPRPEDNGTGFSLGAKVLYKGGSWLIVAIGFQDGQKLIALEPEESKIWVHPEEIVPIQ
jgi:hypothetical protein